jgi:hypothetical protein
MNKITIVVSGGVVQDVFAQTPDVEIELLDFDNAEAEGTKDQMQERFDEVVDITSHVF